MSYAKRFKKIFKINNFEEILNNIYLNNSLEQGVQPVQI